MGIVISKSHTDHFSVIKVEKQDSEKLASLRRKFEKEKVKESDSCRCHCRQLETDSARKETVEKWKQLYLAVKIELDELIRRTTENHLIRSKWDKYCCQDEGFVKQGILIELKVKDEILEVLGGRLMVMERERKRREREIDILRQSLRILTNSMRTKERRNIKKAFRYD